MRSSSSMFLSSVAGVAIICSSNRVYAQGIQPFDERLAANIGQVITTYGPVYPSALGAVLPHEHILIGWGIDERSVYPNRVQAANLNDVDLAAEEVTAFAGYQSPLFPTPRTIVDVTTRGLRWESCFDEHACTTSGIGAIGQPFQGRRTCRSISSISHFVRFTLQRPAE
jgi:hypothetical protein